MRIYKLIICLVFSLLFAVPAFSQTLLSADGNTNTYDLINSVLAPGYSVIETPDCSHEEFGDHIDQSMDSDLGKYVFRFHIHVDYDNDRCINDDRQRTEIKTYDKSPDNLKAIDGEIVEYKWKFKLDAGFQTSSSFTHLHQIKAVGGSEEGMPLITLTARSTNKLQLRYAKYSSQETIDEVTLAPFLGQWVEVTERILFGEEGTFHIEIKRISDGLTLMNYSNESIRMWKTDADFLRPKWGIYRSLDNWEDLRDEIVLFNDFSIQELEDTAILTERRELFKIKPNPTKGAFSISSSSNASLDLYDFNGNKLHTMANVSNNEMLDFGLKTGVYLLILRNEYHTASRRLVVW